MKYIIIGMILFLIIGIYSVYNNSKACNARSCPIDHKPKLVRDAGCICVLEAK